MAESELGTAVLSLRVETGPALAALKAFRAQVEGSLGTADTSALFKGVENDARTAGEKAGRALSSGIKSQTKKLEFLSFQQALDFNPKNSIRGLEEYASALRNLRDKTDLTVAGTQQLTDRLGAVQAALKRARQTTAETSEEQRRLNEALNRVALKRLSDLAKVAEANAKQFRKMREQAEEAAKAVAGLAAKGVGEALKVPVFGLPNNITSTFDKARAQVQRLQRQAETASGKVARLTDGIALLGAGGFAAKGIIDVLGGIGGAANDTVGALNEVRQVLESLPGPLKGLGGLDEIFSSGSQAVSNWSSSILQAQGDLSTLAAPLEAVTNSLSALGPEAALVGGALAFTFAGFQDLIAQRFKPGIDGARAALKGMTADTQALLEALARVSDASEGVASLRDLRIAEKDAATRVEANPVGSEENLQATSELLDIQRRIKEELQAQFYQEQSLVLSGRERAQVAQQLIDAGKPAGPLALPSSEALDARIKADNGAQPQRLSTSGFNQTNEAQVAALRSQAEAERQIAAAARGARTEQIEINQVLEAGLQVLRTTVDVINEQALGYKFQNEQLEDQLEKQTRLRNLETQRSNDSRKKLAQDAQARKDRALKAGDALLDAEPETRLFGLDDKAKKKLRESVGSGLIGGVFPLLFGQGIGASVGGGALGTIGGMGGSQLGFGLSLVGTAIGQLVDQTVSRLSLLGSALDDPIGKFQELAEAGLISSKSLEKNIGALIANGKEAEAAARIQLDIAQQFGDTTELQQLSKASDELQRGFASASVMVAKFVAGPLGDFTSKLALSFRLIAERGVVNERVQQLGLSARQRTSLVAEARNNVGGDPRELYAEVNRLLDERYGKTKQIIDAETAINNAIRRQSELQSNSYRQIDAEAFGNKRLKMEKEIEAIELRRREELAKPGLASEAIADINRKAAQDTYRVKQDIARFDRDTWAQNIAAANQLRSIQEDIAIQQQRGGLTATGIGALQTLKELRDAKRAEQDAQAALRAEPGNNSLLNASQIAADNVKRAAAKAKADLEDAFLSAQNAVRSISRGIEDSVASLSELRNSRDQGLNRFLSPQQVSDRQAAEGVRLAKEAQSIAEKLGIRFSITGTQEQRNAQLNDFINSFRREERLVEDIGQAQRDLAKATNDLSVVNDGLKTVTSELAAATATLAQNTATLASKDWNVYVNAPATADLPRGMEVYQ